MSTKLVHLDYAGELARFLMQLPSTLELEGDDDLGSMFQKLANVTVSLQVHERLFDEQQMPRRSIVIAINGKTVRDRLDAKLNNGDRVTLLSLVAGG